MADLQLQLRLTANGSQLTGTLRTATGQVREFQAAADEAGRGASRGLSEAEKGAANAGKAIAGMVTAAVGAFALLVRGQVELADQVGNTAARLGASTEAISGLGAAARRNNSDLAAVTSGLDSVGEAAVRAATTTNTAGRQSSAAFNAIGVSVLNASGQIKPATQLFEEVARGLARLPDGALKSKLASDLLGQSGKELSGTLGELAREGLQGVIDKAEETGEVISALDASRAKELKDQIQEVQTKVAALAGSIAQAALPTLSALMDLMLDTGDAAKKSGGESTTLRTILENLGRGVVVVSETFRVLFTMLYGGIDVFVGVVQAAGRATQGLAFVAASGAAAHTGNFTAAAEYAEKAKTAFGKGWDEIRDHATNAWSNITAAGADADAKLAAYNRSIAASHSEFANVVSGVTTPALNGNRSATEELAETLARYQAGLRNGEKDERARADLAKKQAAAVYELAQALSDQRGALSPLDEATEAYKQRVTNANQQVAEWARLGIQGAAVQQYLRGEVEAAGKALAVATTEIAKQADVLGTYRKEVAQQRELVGMTERQRAVAEAVNRVTAEYLKNEAAGHVMADALQFVQAGAAATAGNLYDAQEAASGVQDIIAKYGEIDAFEKLVSDIQKVEDALDKALGEGATEKVEELQRTLGNMRHSMVTGIVDSSQAGLRSIQSMTTEGSRAFQAMQIAIDALTVIQAISAVLNQAQGDPYTAFARMAAMAAAVAALGVSIGNFGSGGGPSAQSAEVRQAQQGTGTVLGDAEAKSESIANAIEITADATSELVAINRGMLNALLTLQRALGAAGNMLARGAGDVDFGGLDSTSYGLMGPVGQYNPLLNAMTGGYDPIGNAIGGWLWGGDQDIIDEGILIAGGWLNDMLNGIVVGAYQTIETDGGLFGSDSTDDRLSPVSEEFTRQFQLVVGSIVDTVREGALAIGLLPEEIEARIAAYQVEETRISLSGLSAEEKQAELQAVFSAMFDGVSAAVVPFIGQFQRVGEGLGETLVRVATEVQVVQEASRQLGLSIDEADPERFAQIADSLIEAAGGIDSFIENMNSFVSNFGDTGHQLQVVTGAITSAFSQAGITLPATREGMWALMQTLDATTEEGREQIATLLRLADAAGQYYDLLEQQVSKMAEYADLLAQLAAEAEALGEFSGFDAARLKITAWERQTIAQANELAQAAGLQGASEEALALIHTVAARRVAQAIELLRAETVSLAQQLGYIRGNRDAANDAVYDFGSRTVDQFDRIGAAADDLYERQLSGIKSIQDYLIQMQFGDLSALTPEEQLEEARRQLLELQAAALAGDADAMQALPQMAQTFLSLLRGMDASGGDFNAGYEWVRQLLQSVVDLGPTAEPPGDQAGVGGNPITQEYLDGRDARLAEQDEINRLVLAQQLTQHLGDLAEALNIPVLELAAEMGVPLQQLAEDLGINLQEITGASVEALASMATELGLPLGQLVQALGLELPDLAAGVRELTESLGIDLSNLTTDTVQQLGDLATSLGVNLRDLSTALGIDLGKLTDVNSPIFVALGETIDTLSPDIKTELEPLLDAVRGAAGDEEKNEAVKALRDHVDAMAPDIKNLLAPYFDDILPADAMDQLDYLQSMADDTTSMRDALIDARALLGDIRDYLHDANDAAGVPGYAVGSAYIPYDHLAMVHQGEKIIDAQSAAVLERYGIRVASAPAANDGRVLAELRTMNERLALLDRNNSEGHRATHDATRDVGQAASLQRDDLARRAEEVQRSFAYERRAG